MVRALLGPTDWWRCYHKKDAPLAGGGTRGKEHGRGDLPPTLRLALGPSKRLSRWQLTGTELEGLNTAPRSTALRALYNGPDDTRSRVVSLCRGRRDSGSRRCGFWFFGMWLGGARAGRTDSCSCGPQSVLRREAAPAVGSAQPTTRSHWCHAIHMAHAVTKLRLFALNAASMHSIKRSTLKGLGK
jgi:hypothetical protein